MKKIFCLLFVLFCGFYMFSDENITDNTELIQSLQDENAQLKEMIYNKAFVNINGDVVEINGLVRGFSLAYSKYLQALDKLEKHGSLIVLSDENTLDYKPYQHDDFYVMVSLRNQTILDPEPKQLYNYYLKKNKNISDNEQVITYKYYYFLIITNIITLVFLVILLIVLIVSKNNIHMYINNNKNILYDWICKKIDIISDKQNLIKSSLDKSIDLSIALTDCCQKLIKKNNKINFTNNFDGLNVKIINLLKNKGIKDLSSLLNTTWEELKHTRNFGLVTERQLREWLKERELKLKDEK